MPSFTTRTFSLLTIFTNVCGAATVFLVNESDISVLNKKILFVVNQSSVIMQRNCPWLFMFVEKFTNREAERNRPRPPIQRLPATHLKLIERARSNQGNTVLVCTEKNERSRIWDWNFQLAHKIKIVSAFTTCHSRCGFSYFSSYGNSILYNERVEIGGNTIQFYHKLEQPFRSYCHRYIGIFVYKPMGGVQLLYTKWVSLVGCKHSNTYNFSLSSANHLKFRR